MKTSGARGLARVTWLTLLLFFAVNFAYSGFLAVSHDKASDDALGYYALARNLHEGQGFSRDYKSDLGTIETKPPFKSQGRFLYPYLVSVAFPLFGTSIATSNLVAAFFKALLVIPIVLIGKYLFDDDPTGLLAGLLYTFNPMYAGMGIVTMPETTIAAFYYLCVLFLIRYYQTTRRALLLPAGLALSLSYLARPEGLFLVLLGAGTVVLSQLLVRRRALIPLLIDFGCFLILPALTGSLGSWLVYGQVGTLSPYQTPLTTLSYWADYYTLGGFSLASYLDRVGGWAGALGVRVFNVLLFLRNTLADGLWLDRRMGLLPISFVLPLVAAYFRPLPRRERVYLWGLTLFIVAQFLFTIGYPGYPRMSADYRHGQVVGPFLIVLAAAGLIYLCRGFVWAGRQLAGRWLSKACGYLLLAQYTVFCLVLLSLGLNDTLWVAAVQDPLVEGSQWVRSNLPPEAVIMSRRPTVANYISARTAIVIPSAPYADIMEFARQHGVTHLLMTGQERAGLPNLQEGLEVFADHFRRLYTTDSFYVAAVDSYDYGGTRPTVQDDWYVGPENVRRHLYDWNDLLAYEASHALEEVGDVWSQWLTRANKGIWGLAKNSGTPTAMRYPSGARLGDSVQLVGYDVSPERVGPGGSVELTLYWRCLQPMETGYTVFTHALDESGAVRAQQDHPPLSGDRPTNRWEAGELIRDRYMLTMDAAAPPGTYQIEVGMYDSQSGERVPAYDPAGQALTDRRVLLNHLKVK